MDKLQQTEFALNVFCKRILPAYFFSKNEELFLKWQGNICKQAALLSVPVIEHFVGGEYTVEAYEGWFEHEDLGTYNHCWNYLRNKMGGRNIICDFTSTISYFDYCMHNDPTLHLLTSPMQVFPPTKIKMLRTKKLDVEQHFTEIEFYTQQPSKDVLLETKILLHISKLW